MQNELIKVNYFNKFKCIRTQTTLNTNDLEILHSFLWKRVYKEQGVAWTTQADYQEGWNVACMEFESQHFESYEEYAPHESDSNPMNYKEAVINFMLFELLWDK